MRKVWDPVWTLPSLDCIAGIFEDGGTYTSVSRPRNEYRRNVQRILDCRRSHHLDGKFRRVHHAPADVLKAGKRITLTILINADPADLNRLEPAFIQSECPNLNGPVVG